MHMNDFYYVHCIVQASLHSTLHHCSVTLHDNERSAEEMAILTARL